MSVSVRTNRPNPVGPPPHRLNMAESRAALIERAKRGTAKRARSARKLAQKTPHPHPSAAAVEEAKQVLAEARASEATPKS